MKSKSLLIIVTAFTTTWLLSIQAAAQNHKYDSVGKFQEALANKLTVKPVYLLEENFDNNNNKWGVWDNEGSGAKVYNGNYRFEVKQSNSYLSWLGVPQLASNQTKDFSIETKIFLNGTETGNANDSYWVMWGVGNSGKDYYTLGIYPEGKFQYGKSANGQWNAMTGNISSSAINAGINKANVLRVEKKKDNILFFINGVEVHKANYETFNTANAGIGFKLNNKKLLDIDYLKIYTGAESTSVKSGNLQSTVLLSPEPYESDYQKKLTAAVNSMQRADAIIDYYLAIKQLSYNADQLEKLLGQKYLQMMDIDYHGFYQVLMSRRIKADDITLCMKASEVLTKEQRAAMLSISQYKVDEFQANQNYAAKPAYPPGVPQPGYGWGKTVSSNKSKPATTTTYTQPSPPPAVYIPTEAKALIDRGYYKNTYYTDVFGGFHSVSKICFVQSISGDYANVLSIMSNNSEVKNDSIPWREITRSNSPYISLKKWYIICKVCTGLGTVQAKVINSHTNDYTYTLGKKQTITTTTYQNVACDKCGGCGMSAKDGSGYEWPQPHFQKKAK